jgi:hypothetical protein
MSNNYSVQEMAQETALKILADFSLAIDPTLTESGVAADAKATGDKLKPIEEDASDLLPRSGGDMGGNVISGVGEALDARDMENKASADNHHVHMEVALTADGWGAEAPYSQTVSTPGITEADHPHYGLVEVDDKLKMDDFGMIAYMYFSGGEATAVCLDEKPQHDITLWIEVNR